MEIIGIIALLVLFGYTILAGYEYVMLTHGFGSEDKIDYIFSWGVLIIGIIGFVLTLYFNIEIDIKG